MNIGILLCDQVETHLRSRHGNYATMYSSWLDQSGHTFSYKYYNAEQEEHPKDIHSCDAYVISGSRHSVNDGSPWVAKLAALVSQLHAHKKKLVGICFGHQLIAKTLGGTVISSPNGWGVGVSVSPITQQTHWMMPVLEKINLPVSHGEQVVELPANSNILASTEFCPYYMLQIEKHILTVQGHPEFSKDYAKDLMEMRKNKLSAKCFQQGLNSLNLHSDGEIMAKWTGNFLSFETYDS